MKFNQLQKIAKKAGWTKGYAAPKHVAALINTTIDAMTDIERSQLHAEVNAKPLLEPVNFIAGFMDLVGGKLACFKSDGLTDIMQQAERQEGNASGVFDLSKLTDQEKTQFLQVLANMS